jgi:hypothetical protein
MILALVCALLAIAPAHEGDAQAFTSLTDAQGKPLGDSRYSQHIEGGALHIETRTDLPPDRIIVEHAVLRLQPQLEQESWDWTERVGGQLVREYKVDFRTGKAEATRIDQKKRWKEDLSIEPGKSFAGIGFIAVVKALRAQLSPGQHVELQAVAMMPRPRTATVTITRDGTSDVRMAGRTIAGDRYTIHPEIPWIARPFIHAPDQHVWLLKDDPPAFLRFEGPLLEPNDPIVRIDLIAGHSAHAQPRGRPGVR